MHTLTLKRASRIVIEDQKENDYADVAAMLEKCRLLAEAGYRPYYLYRQKNTLQNLENVGWCKPGHEGYYNIYIMEEVQTCLLYTSLAKVSGVIERRLAESGIEGATIKRRVKSIYGRCV